MTTCEHGLPQGCPLHRPNAARRALHAGILAALIALDVATVAAIGWGAWRIARALIAGIT